MPCFWKKRSIQEKFDKETLKFLIEKITELSITMIKLELLVDAFFKRLDNEGVVLLNKK
jgi:hypothetical protein